jgi:excisionase family DNA binding protein
MNTQDIAHSTPTSNLLTPGQVCDILAIPDSTLARWRSEHRELPYVKIGRLVRYRRQDLETWLENHLVNPDE